MLRNPRALLLARNPRTLLLARITTQYIPQTTRNLSTRTGGASTCAAAVCPSRSVMAPPAFASNVAAGGVQAETCATQYGDVTTVSVVEWGGGGGVDVCVPAGRLAGAPPRHARRAVVRRGVGGRERTLPRTTPPPPPLAPTSPPPPLTPLPTHPAQRCCDDSFDLALPTWVTGNVSAMGTCDVLNNTITVPRGNSSTCATQCGDVTTGIVSLPVVLLVAALVTAVGVLVAKCSTRSHGTAVGGGSPPTAARACAYSEGASMPQLPAEEGSISPLWLSVLFAVALATTVLLAIANLSSGVVSLPMGVAVLVLLLVAGIAKASQCASATAAAVASSPPLVAAVAPSPAAPGSACKPSAAELAAAAAARRRRQAQPPQQTPQRTLPALLYALVLVFGFGWATSVAAPGGDGVATASPWGGAPRLATSLEVGGGAGAGWVACALPPSVPASALGGGNATASRSALARGPSAPSTIWGASLAACPGAEGGATAAAALSALPRSDAAWTAFHQRVVGALSSAWAASTLTLAAVALMGVAASLYRGGVATSARSSGDRVEWAPELQAKITAYCLCAAVCLALPAYLSIAALYSVGRAALTASALETVHALVRLAAERGVVALLLLLSVVGALLYDLYTYVPWLCSLCSWASTPQSDPRVTFDAAEAVAEELSGGTGHWPHGSSGKAPHWLYRPDAPPPPWWTTIPWQDCSLVLCLLVLSTVVFIAGDVLVVQYLVASSWGTAAVVATTFGLQYAWACLADLCALLSCDWWLYLLFLAACAIVASPPFDYAVVRPLRAAYIVFLQGHRRPCWGDNSTVSFIATVEGLVTAYTSALGYTYVLAALAVCLVLLAVSACSLSVVALASFLLGTLFLLEPVKWHTGSFDKLAGLRSFDVRHAAAAVAVHVLFALCACSWVAFCCFTAGTVMTVCVRGSSDDAAELVCAELQAIWGNLRASRGWWRAHCPILLPLLNLQPPSSSRRRESPCDVGKWATSCVPSCVQQLWSWASGTSARDAAASWLYARVHLWRGCSEWTELVRSRAWPWEQASIFAGLQLIAPHVTRAHGTAQRVRFVTRENAQAFVAWAAPSYCTLLVQLLAYAAYGGVAAVAVSAAVAVAAAGIACAWAALPQGSACAAFAVLASAAVWWWRTPAAARRAERPPAPAAVDDDSLEASAGHAHARRHVASCGAGLGAAAGVLATVLQLQLSRGAATVAPAAFAEHAAVTVLHAVAGALVGALLGRAAWLSWAPRCQSWDGRVLAAGREIAAARALRDRVSSSDDPRAVYEAACAARDLALREIGALQTRADDACADAVRRGIVDDGDALRSHKRCDPVQTTDVLLLGRLQQVVSLSRSLSSEDEEAAWTQASKDVDEHERKVGASATALLTDVIEQVRRLAGGSAPAHDVAVYDAATGGVTVRALAARGHGGWWCRALWGSRTAGIVIKPTDSTQVRQEGGQGGGGRARNACRATHAVLLPRCALTPPSPPLAGPRVAAAHRDGHPSPQGPPARGRAAHAGARRGLRVRARVAHCGLQLRRPRGRARHWQPRAARAARWHRKPPAPCREPPRERLPRAGARWAGCRRGRPRRLPRSHRGPVHDVLRAAGARSARGGSGRHGLCSRPPGVRQRLRSDRSAAPERGRLRVQPRGRLVAHAQRQRRARRRGAARHGAGARRLALLRLRRRRGRGGPRARRRGRARGGARLHRGRHCARAPPRRRRRHRPRRRAPRAGGVLHPRGRRGRGHRRRVRAGRRRARAARRVHVAVGQRRCAAPPRAPRPRRRRARRRARHGRARSVGPAHVVA